MTTTKTTLKLPETVVYYNGWTGFESMLIGRLFECITYEEATKLEAGATIWIDIEQPSGKVDGYNRSEIVSVKVYDDYVGISFKGPGIEGSASIPKRGSQHKVCRCTNEIKLMELIETSPLATETGTVGTISDSSREHLKDIGAVIVSA